MRVVDKIALENAIDQLPDGYKNVFVLHDVEGFEHEEVARISRMLGRYFEVAAPQGASKTEKALEEESESETRRIDRVKRLDENSNSLPPEAFSGGFFRFDHQRQPY
jgi:hypothetical protein